MAGEQWTGIRGASTRSGVRFWLPEQGTFQDAKMALANALREGPSIRGLAVTLEAGGRPLRVAELRELELLLLEQHGVALLQVIEGAPSETRAPIPAGVVSEGDDRVEGGARWSAAATEVGSGARRGRRAHPSPATARPALPKEAMGLVGSRDLPLSPTATVLVKRTLRSGQRVHFAGNVVVLGDVNPGAEIVAAGDIVVMGTLRGVAHAGATGGEDAIVAAFRLQPTQLRVASYIGRSPDGASAHASVPELARVRDGALVVERFMP